MARRNEFRANWNASTRTVDHRSWTHHNTLGSSNWTVVEDVAGLRPRTDAGVELWPIDIGWSHFAVNDLRYLGVDLSVVRDDPADGVNLASSAPNLACGAAVSASYDVQRWDGGAWVPVPSQVRQPAVARGNYNRVTFTPVTTQRLRVVLTHAPGFRTALTEVKAY